MSFTRPTLTGTIGAFVTYREIMSAASAQLPELKPRDEADFRADRNTNPDMNRMRRSAAPPG